MVRIVSSLISERAHLMRIGLIPYLISMGSMAVPHRVIVSGIHFLVLAALFPPTVHTILLLPILL